MYRGIQVGIPGCVVFAALLACKSSGPETFTGPAEVNGAGYNDEHLAEVVVTLEHKTSTDWVLTFGANSPVQCTLTVDNRNLEDQDPSNDGDLTIRGIRYDPKQSDTCTFRGKDGKTQLAKVRNLSGGRNAGSYLSLDFSLETEPSYFDFSYQGRVK